MLIKTDLIYHNMYAGPHLDNKNLVFALDAGSPRSYPGSGTTWFNLGNSNNGTLTNGPTFNSENGGYFEFDGTNDYIQYSSTQDVGTVFTVNFWIKPNGKARQTIIANGYPYQTNKGFFIACPGNTTDSNSFFLSLGQDDNFVTAANGSLTQGVWQMVTGRVNGPSNKMKLYVNGIETSYSAQDDGNTTLQYNSGNNLTGRRTLSSTDYLESPLACIQIYNRALTEEEIQQNYNALKNRFK